MLRVSTCEALVIGLTIFDWTGCFCSLAASTFTLSIYFYMFSIVGLILLSII